MAEKKKLIEPESLLGDMEELERFNGTSTRKIEDNWYELKRRVVRIIAENAKKEEEKKD